MAATQCCEKAFGALINLHSNRFAAVNLHRQPAIPGYDDLIERLASDDRARLSFLKACLAELGLEVSQGDYTPSPLSSLHLTASDPSQVTELLCNWEDVMDKDKEKGTEIIRGEADTFLIQSEETVWGVGELRDSLSATETLGAVDEGMDGDYSSVTKRIVPHEKGLPDAQLTPRFNHELFFSSLKRFQMIEKEAEDWGNILLYGDVVTSTNTLLEKLRFIRFLLPILPFLKVDCKLTLQNRNPKLISKLPTGFTFSASTQVAGRGRGTNVWVAPPGSLLFSTIINHPAHLAASRPIVFIQYIAAIAIVEAIQSYDIGYEAMPVKLKWPNDICEYWTCTTNRLFSPKVDSQTDTSRSTTLRCPRSNQTVVDQILCQNWGHPFPVRLL